MVSVNNRRLRRRQASAILATALLPALGACSTEAGEPIESASASLSSETAVESVADSRWNGTMDGNSISLRFEDDGTIAVERYNGTGPFDVAEDVWEESDGVITLTLTGLYVLGEDPRIVNVTARGSIVGDELELTGEYSDGAPASIHLTASVS